MNAYNQDVAILSCEELAGDRKGNCQRLVIEYMDPFECSPPTDCSKAPTRGKKLSQETKLEPQKIKCIKKLYYFMITNTNKYIKNSFVIKKELRKKFDKNLSNLIFNKIVNRIRKLGPCLEWFLIFNEIKKIIKIIIKLIKE